MALLTVVPFVVPLAILVADRPPALNVEPSCRAAEARAASQAPLEVCLRTENEAQGQIAKRWAEFPPADRTYCLQLSTMGGTPSYVELLTCLEMANEAKTHPDGTTPSATVGQTSPRPKR